MPKKFKGENSKAAEARARKTAAKAAEEEAKQKALEDEYWRDDDKHVAKKQARKVSVVEKNTHTKKNSRTILKTDVNT